MQAGTRLQAEAVVDRLQPQLRGVSRQWQENIFKDQESSRAGDVLAVRNVRENIQLMGAAAHTAAKCIIPSRLTSGRDNYYSKRSIVSKHV